MQGANLMREQTRKGGATTVDKGHRMGQGASDQKLELRRGPVRAAYTLGQGVKENSQAKMPSEELLEVANEMEEESQWKGLVVKERRISSFGSSEDR